MKKLQVGKSGIHGKGLFITEPARKGEVISILRGEITRKRNKTKQDALDNPYWIGMSKEVWLDPDDPYRSINHSCNPSAGIKGRVTLVALRNLKLGDEITIDYSLVEGDPRWRMKCKCGYKYCRKVIKSVGFLPKNVFNRYMPFVPTYFQKVYNKTHSR